MSLTDPAGRLPVLFRVAHDGKVTFTIFATEGSVDATVIWKNESPVGALSRVTGMSIWSPTAPIGPPPTVIVVAVAIPASPARSTQIIPAILNVVSNFIVVHLIPENGWNLFSSITGVGR
jgi:hypothetical protein